jgi:hypothetical protein
MRNKKFQSLIDFIDNQLDDLSFIKPTKSNYTDRFNLAMYISQYIVKGQNMYLNADTSIPTQDIVDFDNKISICACRLYEVMEGLLAEYIEKRISIGIEEVGDLLDSRNQMLYISARWNTLQVMKVFDMDRERNKQKVPRRLPLLVEPCFCLDRVLETKMGILHEDGFNPNRMVGCLPPSSGKTYGANAYTNLMIMHHWIRYGETGLIRMTNNAVNAQAYGNQCATMIEDKAWQNIFPEIKNYINYKGVLDCFKNRSSEKLLLKDCNSECSDSIFMFGVDAGINGKRSLLGAVLDDLSNGIDEMDNDERHRQITDKVMSDVMDRSDDDDAPIILFGTMYNQYDYQNTFVDAWEKEGLKKLKKFKFIRVTPDGKKCVCLVDIENANGNSIAPDLYTDKKLVEKRAYFENRGKPYVYNLIYRQRRDSREPKTFDLQYLDTYNYKQLKQANLDDYAVTMIDTTRKSGNDFFSMPILRKNLDNGKYRLIDCIFEQKSLGIVDDPNNVFAKKVCNKIIEDKVIDCCVENNTSNTTSALLKSICEGMKYKSCKFRERFTSKKGKSSTKIVRILNMEETIKNYIEFPDPTTLPATHPLRLYIQYLTNWSSTEGQKKTNPDDAPDSLAMFAEEFIFKRQRKGVIKEFTKNFQLF